MTTTLRSTVPKLSEREGEENTSCEKENGPQLKKGRVFVGPNAMATGERRKGFPAMRGRKFLWGVDREILFGCKRRGKQDFTTSSIKGGGKSEEEEKGMHAFHKTVIKS